MTEFLVFVYGSLKRGEPHHDRMVGAIFEGETCLFGYHLVAYEEAYPALVSSPEGGESSHVFGEIFRVTADQLRSLDEFEECPTLYQRSPVLLADGRSAQAYVIPEERAAPYLRIGASWSAPVK